MLQIDESSLKILLRSKSVKQFNLVEDDGGFDVFLQMTNGEPGMLVTVREPGKPRHRKSVDKFIRWLQHQDTGLPQICISFRRQ